MGKVYQNSPKCREFAAAIAQVQRNEIASHLAHCKFVAVLVDGSMDSASTDNEMVYIQTCYQGVVHTNFICCCQVKRAEVLFKP